MSDINIFEQATKQRLRFTSSRGGEFSVEDLWQLPLTARNDNQPNLDAIAIALNKEIRASAEQESFVTKKSKSNVTAELALDVVKRIIEVRLVEQEIAQTAKETAQRKARLKELLIAKRNGADEQLTTEQLEAELAALDA